MHDNDTRILAHEYLLIREGMRSDSNEIPLPDLSDAVVDFKSDSPNDIFNIAIPTSYYSPQDNVFIAFKPNPDKTNSEINFAAHTLKAGPTFNGAQPPVGMISQADYNGIINHGVSMYINKNINFHKIKLIVTPSSRSENPKDIAKEMSRYANWIKPSDIINNFFRKITKGELKDIKIKEGGYQSLISFSEADKKHEIEYIKIITQYLDAWLNSDIPDTEEFSLKNIFPRNRSVFHDRMVVNWLKLIDENATKLQQKINENGPNKLHILIIDDNINTKKTMQEVKTLLTPWSNQIVINWFFLFAYPNYTSKGYKSKHVTQMDPIEFYRTKSVAPGLPAAKSHYKAAYKRSKR